MLPADHLQKDLLGKTVPVAAHGLFVGRRRELQQALRVLDGNTDAGVLLTGMGRLGKSSLAARLANRRRDDLTLVVLHGRFGVQEVLARLDEALRSDPTARDLRRRRHPRWKPTATQPPRNSAGTSCNSSRVPATPPPRHSRRLEAAAAGQHKTVDPVAVAALVLSIPSALPAVLDVADRIAKRRRATTLIETAARIRIERRVEVLTITADGARPLADLDPDALLELVRRE